MGTTGKQRAKSEYKWTPMGPGVLCGWTRAASGRRFYRLPLEYSVIAGIDPERSWR
jgi:hypothetical protein